MSKYEAMMMSVARRIFNIWIDRGVWSMKSGLLEFVCQFEGVFLHDLALNYLIPIMWLLK